jgi:hypothetical protein
VNIGQAGATTTVKGTLNVDQAVTLDTTLTVAANQTSQLGGDVTVKSSIDTISAGALELGKATATSVNIAKVGVTTDIQGPITVLGGIDTASSAALALGAATATSVNIADSGVMTTIEGDLTVEGSSVRLGTGGNQVVLGGDIQIGTSSSAELGFYGQSPVSRTSITNLPTGIFMEYPPLESKVNEIIDALQALGLIQ